MYIPKVNAETDKLKIVAFMKQFSFATIITSINKSPVATHLPFLITIKDENIILTSHFAKANDHWREIENNRNLVIFSEPHAYISPKNYDSKLNVPTWNYIAVHTYGYGKLITENAKVSEVLEATMNNFEMAFRKQWDEFPVEYKLRMAKGIVAFEIIVTELQAKKKLSQNRTDNEKQKIIDDLLKSNSSTERLIAEYMKNLENNE